MSGRDWKPGEVAVIRVPKSSAPGFGISEHGNVDLRASWCNGGWSALDEPDYFWSGDYSFHAAEPRPLVVIDPEDREQVERLRDQYDRLVIQMNDDPDPRDVTPIQRASAMQAAFRSLVEPPKPPEPMGLGAVVEDADGVGWIKIDTHSGCNDWTRVGARVRHEGGVTPGTVRWTYAEIDVVRVLSEGVTP